MPCQTKLLPYHVTRNKFHPNSISSLSTQQAVVYGIMNGPGANLTDPGTNHSSRDSSPSPPRTPPQNSSNYLLSPGSAYPLDLDDPIAELRHRVSLRLAERIAAAEEVPRSIFNLRLRILANARRRQLARQEANRQILSGTADPDLLPDPDAGLELPNGHPQVWPIDDPAGNSPDEDSAQEEVPREDSAEVYGAEENSAEEDSTEEYIPEESSSEEDSFEEGSAEEGSAEEDSAEEDSAEEDSAEDSAEQDNAEESAQDTAEVTGQNTAQDLHVATAPRDC